MGNHEQGGVAPVVRAAVVLLLTGLPAAARPQALPKLTVERLHADPPLSGALPTNLAWHPDGRRLTYLRGTGAATRLCAFDVKSGTETMLLDAQRLHAPGALGRALSLAGASWLADGRRLLVSSEGDLFLLDAATGAVRALVSSAETEEYATASPDGRLVAFERGNDLYVVHTSSGQESRLTRNGSETLLNGRLDWVYEEELAWRTGRAFAWAPNSRALAYLQLDQARVPRFPIVDFLPVPNQVRWQRYPTPGAPNATVRLGLAVLGKDGALLSGQVLDLLPSDGYLLPQLAWTSDSRGLAAQCLNRAQNELQLRLLTVSGSPDATLASARVVLTERSRTWLNTFGAPRFRRMAGASSGPRSARASLTTICATSAEAAAPSPRGRGRSRVESPSRVPPIPTSSTIGAGSSTSRPPRRTRASAISIASVWTAPAVAA